MARWEDDELRLICLERALNFLKDSGDNVDGAITTAEKFFCFVKDGDVPDDD